MKMVAKAIDVISKTDKEGVITPVKFRIEAHDESEIEIKIGRILTRELEKLAGNKMLVFKCEGEINGAVKTYELKYGLDTCKWMMFRIW